MDEYQKQSGRVGDTSALQYTNEPPAADGASAWRTDARGRPHCCHCLVKIKNLVSSIQDPAACWLRSAASDHGPLVSTATVSARWMATRLTRMCCLLPAAAVCAPASTTQVSPRREFYRLGVAEASHNYKTAK
jgi:hypothetical protein